MTRYIKTKVIRELVDESDKCANYPNSDVIKNYNCPMWIMNNGLFDESGYNIDHKEEFSKTHNNDLSNLQLLCVCCHKVKTKLFMDNKCEFTSTQISRGAGFMDVVEEECGKKRKR